MQGMQGMPGGPGGRGGMGGGGSSDAVFDPQFPHKVTGVDCIAYKAPHSLSSSTNVTRSISTIKPHSQHSSENCTICWEPLSKETSAKINACGHKFHQGCIDECLNREPKCPICRLPIGEPQGPCPSGSMTIALSKNTCPGYNDAKAIQIEYDLPIGKQSLYHDAPGQIYVPTYRIAFLPDTDEGRHLLTRLKYAWTCGLLFTVGTSLTTGMTNAIVWTSVHHKTSLWGGPYSFPDPNYVANCNGSLDALYVPDAEICLQRLRKTASTSDDDDDDDDIAEEISYDAPTSLSSSLAVAGAFTPVQGNSSGECAICLDPLSETSVIIHKCSHMFHRKCIDKCLDRELLCPVCRCTVGEPQGKSPSGSMKIKKLKQQGCPGFECTDTIQIEYHIPPGTQQSYHGNPGIPYRGTVRIAYLPLNNEGNRLLTRLKFAWKHGLVFKIGTSLTTGASNAVSWAGIHHKTKLRGGAYGFPDTRYFTMCHESLDEAGVPNSE